MATLNENQAKLFTDRNWGVSAPDGDRTRGPLARLGQALDPQHERIAQALRGGATTVEAGGQQLLGIERVALAAGEEPVDELGGGRVAEDVGQRLGQLGAIERDQLEPAGAGQTLEL